MKRYVLDTEGNGLHPTLLWLVILLDIDTEEIFIFRKDNKFLGLQELLDGADVVVGHNIFGYDLINLKKLYSITVDHSKVYDTMILSMMLNVKLEGGHSLEAWGKTLGFPKGGFNDFSSYSIAMENYCINDCRLTSKLFLYLWNTWFGKEEWKSSVQCEMRQASILTDTSQRGFKFNYTEAVLIQKELKERIQTLLDELQEAFPPKEVITVMKTKTKVEYVPFNPKSPKQVIERLNEIGWKPYEKTKGHEELRKRGSKKDKKEHYKIYGYKVSENNLATIPEDAPEAARKLVLYLLLTSRLSTLEEWFKAYQRKTGAIHGTFFTMGAWTHRKIHTNPNMGNIPTSKSIKYTTPSLVKEALDYGKRFRQLWVARKGYKLVGTDAEGIQLRIFAHYVNDSNLIEAILKGDKSNGTDIHSLNQRALGEVCKSRDDAKTFIYAFLLGAGTNKIGQILKCSSQEAKKAVETFLEFYPGLRRLKEVDIPRDASRGWFLGLDGRKVVVDSEHKVLAGYLQNGESVIMKHACNLWHTWYLGKEVFMVNDVHDEFVTEVKDEGDLPKEVGEAQCEAIRLVGEQLKLRCPLSGSTKVGDNWYDVH